MWVCEVMFFFFLFLIGVQNWGEPDFFFPKREVRRRKKREEKTATTSLCVFFFSFARSHRPRIVTPDHGELACRTPPTPPPRAGAAEAASEGRDLTPHPLLFFPQALSADGLKLVARELKELHAKPEDGIRVREWGGELRENEAVEGDARAHMERLGSASRPRSPPALTKTYTHQQVVVNEDNVADVQADIEGPSEFF